MTPFLGSFSVPRIGVIFTLLEQSDPNFGVRIRPQFWDRHFLEISALGAERS